MPSASIRVEGAGGVGLAVDLVTPEPEPPRPPGFLLVHGLASNARLWDGVAAELAGRGYASAAVDLRGHGRSDKPDEGYDYGTLCADLVAVTAAFGEAVGVERIVAAGQSFGGNLVLELAARQPPALAGVACVDGGTIDLGARFASYEEVARALAPPRLEGTPAPEMEQRLRAMHPDWPEAGIAGTLANFEVRPDGTVAPWLTLPRHLTILRTMWQSRPSEVYTRVEVPVLLLAAGRPDDAGDWSREKAAGVEAAAAALADAQVRWCSPADHDVHAQHPRAVAEALLERFAGPPPGV